MVDVNKTWFRDFIHSEGDGRVVLAGYNDMIGATTGDDIIEGGPNEDILFGESGDDFLDGGASNDILFGESGNDVLIGGTDALISGELHTFLWADGYDRLDGGTGNDVLTGGLRGDVFVFAPGYGADTITDFRAPLHFSSSDDDKIDLSGFTTIRSFPDVQLITTQVGSDIVLNFGNGNTLTLTGVTTSRLTAANFVLSGGAGGKTIYGSSGNDYIVGGEGNDTISGGVDGQDSLYGGGGNDYIIAADANNDGFGAVLDGGDGANQLYALVGVGQDYAVGGELADIIATGGGSDYIFGSGGNDTIVAGTSTDYIFGDAGDDFIYTDDLVTNSQDFVYVSGLSGFGTGIDTVADFTPGAGGDVAVILATSGLTSFAQVQANMTDVGVYTVVNLSAGDQLYLYSIDPAQLTADNFLLL